jgi:hypothetical protein
MLPGCGYNFLYVFKGGPSARQRRALARTRIESRRRKVPKSECVRRGGDGHQDDGLSGE